MITQERLKELFHYDPETGLFTRKNDGHRTKAGDVAGSNEGNGYLVINVEGKQVKCHRLAFLYMTGTIPKWVDHVNGDRKDNRFNNLRPATPSQNAHNAGIRSDNTSGVKGVTWHKPNGKWLASLYHNRKRIYLGYHTSLEEASRVVSEARNKLHGEYARES